MASVFRHSNRRRFLDASCGRTMRVRMVLVAPDWDSTCAANSSSARAGVSGSSLPKGKGQHSLFLCQSEAQITCSDYRKEDVLKEGNENKALIQLLFEEVIQGGNLAKVDEIFSADFVDLSTPDQWAGREGVKGYLRMVRTGFPDLSVTLDDVIAEGDRVVVRSTWRGTHL